MGELNELRDLVVKFRDIRNWRQFHTPKNLVQALASEVGELNDLYLWDRSPSLFDVCEEMADILIYLLSLADVIEIDLFDAVLAKLNKNNKKYPANKFNGNSSKSTEKIPQ